MPRPYVRRLPTRHSVPCPFCGARDSRVLATRQQPDGRLSRRRECRVCHRRYTTDEHIGIPDVPRDVPRRTPRQQENREEPTPDAPFP